MGPVGFTPTAKAAADTYQAPLETSKYKTYKALADLSPTLWKVAEMHGQKYKQQKLQDMQEEWQSDSSIQDRKSMSQKEYLERELKDPTFAADNPWRHVFIEEMLGQTVATGDLYDALNSDELKDFLSDPNNSRGDVQLKINDVVLQMRPTGLYAGASYDKHSAQVVQHFTQKSLSQREATQKQNTVDASGTAIRNQLGHFLRDPKSELDMDLLTQNLSELHDVTRESGMKPTLDSLTKLIKAQIELRNPDGTFKTQEQIQSIKNRGVELYKQLMTVVDGPNRKNWGSYITPTDQDVWIQAINDYSQQAQLSSFEEDQNKKMLVKNRMKESSGRFFQEASTMGFETAFDNFKSVWDSVRQEVGIKDDLVDKQKNWDDEKAFMRALYLEESKRAQDFLMNTEKDAYQVGISAALDQSDTAMTDDELVRHFSALGLSQEQMENLKTIRRNGVSVFSNKAMPLDTFLDLARERINTLRGTKNTNIDRNLWTKIWNDWQTTVAIRSSQDPKLLQDPSLLLEWIENTVKEETEVILQKNVDQQITSANPDYDEFDVFADLQQNNQYEMRLDNYANELQAKLGFVEIDGQRMPITGLRNNAVELKNFAYEATYIFNKLALEYSHLAPAERFEEVVRQLDTLKTKEEIIARFPELDHKDESVREGNPQSKAYWGLGTYGNANTMTYPEYDDNPINENDIQPIGSNWAQPGTIEWNMLSPTERHRHSLANMDKNIREKNINQQMQGFQSMTLDFMVQADFEDAGNISEVVKFLNPSETGNFVSDSDFLRNSQEMLEMERAEFFDESDPLYKEKKARYDTRKAEFIEAQGKLSKFAKLNFGSMTLRNNRRLAVMAKMSGLNNNGDVVTADVRQTSLTIEEIAANKISFMGSDYHLNADFFDPTRFLMFPQEGQTWEDVYDALPPSVQNRLERDGEEDGLTAIQELEEKQNALAKLRFYEIPTTTTEEE